MPNPLIPREGEGRPVPFLMDAAGAYLFTGEGGIDTGGTEGGAVYVLLSPFDVGTRLPLTVPDDADTLILEASATRRTATIHNDSAGVLYLGLGSAPVSATDYTVAVPGGGDYELPFNFTGQVRGIAAP